MTAMVACLAAFVAVGAEPRPVSAADKEIDALFSAVESLAKAGKLDAAAALQAVNDMSAFGDRLTNAGRYPEAAEARGRALRVAEISLGPKHDRTVDLVHAHGESLVKAGRYGEAQRALERALIDSRAIGIADSDRRMLATLNGLAVILSSSGQFRDAEELFVRVLAVLETNRPPEDAGRLSVMNNLGEVRLALRPDKAREIRRTFEEVVRVRSRVLAPDHPDTLLARANVAATYFKEGLFDDALRENQAVYSLRRKVLAADHPATLTSMLAVASALDSKKRFPEARDLYAELLGLREKALGPDHPHSLDALRMLAGVLAQMDDFTAAKPRYEELIARYESQRTRGAPTDAQRRFTFATYVNSYKYYARTLIGRGEYADAFRIMEMSKARSLLDVSAVRDAVKAASLSAAERAELAALERLVAARTAGLSGITDEFERAAAQADINRRSGELAALLAALAKKYPRFAAASDIQLASAAAARTLLDKDSVFVSYLLLGDAPMVLWVDESGVAGGAVFGRQTGLADTVEAFRAAIADPRGIEGLRNPLDGGPTRYVWEMKNGSYRIAPLSSGVPDAALEPVHDIEPLRKRLSALLVDSVPVALRSRKRWIVSPDGILAFVPFEALAFDGELGIERREIVYSHSLSMLALVAQRASQYQRLPRQPALVMGNPVYDGAAGSRWRPLPGSAREIGELQKVFALEEGKSLFSGAAASEATLARLDRTGALRGFRHMVFSAHGYLHPRFPMESGIVLSQLNVEAGTDGFVKAAEWSAYDLRTDLIVVSACESGIGESLSGEGLLGLPFAFYVAGNTSSVLSLWPVYDDSTAEFMRDFLARVRDGEPIDQALARTKREFASGRKSERWKAPAYWAPFVLYGYTVH